MAPLNVFEIDKENLVHKVLYHKFTISYEDTGLHSTFSLSVSVVLCSF